MIWNFVLDNQLTYRDKPLKGRAFFYGLITFYLVCSLGTFVNVGVAIGLYQFNSGLILAVFAGSILGSVFNYAASFVLTWRK
jgi:dolichol-phosphate mannosyltransferase